MAAHNYALTASAKRANTAVSVAVATAAATGEAAATN